MILQFAPSAAGCWDIQGRITNLQWFAQLFWRRYCFSKCKIIQIWKGMLLLFFKNSENSKSRRPCNNCFLQIRKYINNQTLLAKLMNTGYSARQKYQSTESIIFYQIFSTQIYIRAVITIVNQYWLHYFRGFCSM